MNLVNASNGNEMTTKNCQVFLNQWKSSMKHEGAFRLEVEREKRSENSGFIKSRATERNKSITPLCPCNFL